MIKVDKNIPLPKASHGQGGAPRRYPFLTMEIGDSFSCEDINQNRSLYFLAKRDGIKISIRKKGKEIRVWRIA